MAGFLLPSLRIFSWKEIADNLTSSMFRCSRDHPNSPLRIPSSSLNLLDFLNEVGIVRSPNYYPIGVFHDFGFDAGRFGQGFAPRKLCNPILNNHQYEAGNSAIIDTVLTALFIIMVLAFHNTTRAVSQLLVDPHNCNQC
jgi:hypothetical protein